MPVNGLSVQVSDLPIRLQGQSEGRDNAADHNTYVSGDKGVYSLRVNDVSVGTFTITYLNEEHVTEKKVHQNYIEGSGSWYFAPVNLLGTGYVYEIISRPKTLGGKAPWINIYGQFSFEAQVMPMSVSRAGEYIVKVTDDNDSVVTVYKITVY